MKTLIMLALAACTALGIAQAPAKADCCESKKVVAQVEKAKAGHCEAAKVVAKVEKAGHCEAMKVVAQVDKAKSSHCESMESMKVVAQVEKTKSDCCDAKANPLKIYNTKEEDTFFAEAARMELGGKEACCKSTVAHMVAKGGEGCCNASGEPAKFVVKVGKETKYFGCEGSAGKFFAEAKAKGLKPSKVQKVVGKVAMK